MARLNKAPPADMALFAINNIYELPLNVIKDEGPQLIAPPSSALLLLNVTFELPLNVM